MAYDQKKDDKCFRCGGSGLEPSKGKSLCTACILIGFCPNCGMPAWPQACSHAATMPTTACGFCNWQPPFTDIHELDLPIRAEHALLRRGIKTVQDLKKWLVDRPPDSIRGVGHLYSELITQKLEEYDANRIGTNRTPKRIP